MYVERGITKDFDSAARSNSMIVVVGPRQAGKTTFLKEQSKKSGASYLFFDDPDVRELFDLDIKKFENQYMPAGSMTILDEVQYGKDAGKKLKYLVDSGRKLWVTSSSEIILNKEVLSWLVGRTAIIRLYPFSLAEFMAAKGLKEATDRVIARIIDEHISYGGYPKVVMENDTQGKELLLKNLSETMLLKDMAKTFQIEDINALERFVAYLSHYVGAIVQYNSLCKNLGMSFQSVKKYLSAMEKSYLIVLIQPFYSNRLKEITKQPKLYFLDTGLRNAIANEFKAPVETRGSLFENYVLSELMKAGKRVRYWRSKADAEVDFVIQDGERLVPIEVKAKMPRNTIERSMHSFIESYSPKIGFIVFYEGRKGTVKSGKCNVVFTDVKGLIEALR